MSERVPIVRRIDETKRGPVGGMTVAGIVLLGIAALSAVVVGIGPWVAIWGGLGVPLLIGGRVVDAIRARG